MPLSYDITTTAGGSFAGFHYDGIGDSPMFYGPTHFQVGESDFNPNLLLAFDSSLLIGHPVGFVNPLDLAGSSESSGSSSRVFTAGYAVAVAAPVPEPETYAMMLAGLGLLGFVARRRKGQAVAV